jgi:hypothetical protein
MHVDAQRGAEHPRGDQPGAQSGVRARPDAGHDRGQLGQAHARLRQHLLDVAGQQLAVPPGVDRRDMRQHAGSVVDGDGHGWRRGVERKQQHGCPA